MAIIPIRYKERLDGFIHVNSKCKDELAVDLSIAQSVLNDTNSFNELLAFSFFNPAMALFMLHDNCYSASRPQYIVEYTQFAIGRGIQALLPLVPRFALCVLSKPFHPDEP